MFHWLYFRLGKQLDTTRVEARTLYELARLVRCMPGTIALAGEYPDALLQLLASAVGKGREILAFDTLETVEKQTDYRSLSTLPGLTGDQPASGIRRLACGPGQLQRRRLQYCFVHLRQPDPLQLRHTVADFADRLAPYGMLLVHVPEGSNGMAVRQVIDHCLHNRRERAVFLRTGYCLILRMPEAAGNSHAGNHRPERPSPLQASQATGALSVR